MFRRGTQIPPSHIVFEDEHTGARVHRLTAGEMTCHTFFFLTSSFRPGRPNQVGYVMHSDAGPQVCLFDFETGGATVLTERERIHPFSPSFDVSGDRVFYTTRDSAVCCVELETRAEHTLTRLDGAGLGECALSCDGRWLVTAFHREGRHGLLVLNLITGESEEILERDDLKVLHPQFHPTDPMTIIYAGDPAPRLWAVRRDGSDHRCLYRNRQDQFIVHESFLGGGGDELIFAIWPHELARMNMTGNAPRPLVKINAWHMVSDATGRVIVSDTTRPDRGLLLIDPATGEYEPLCYPNATCQGTQWAKDHPAGPEVWAALREEAGADLSWMEMQADHVYGPQWTHPHPAFDHQGERVSFTSDRTGTPQVYVVEAQPLIERLGA